MIYIVSQDGTRIEEMRSFDYVKKVDGGICIYINEKKFAFYESAKIENVKKLVDDICYINKPILFANNIDDFNCVDELSNFKSFQVLSYNNNSNLEFVNNGNIFYRLPSELKDGENSEVGR